MKKGILYGIIRQKVRLTESRRIGLWQNNCRERLGFAFRQSFGVDRLGCLHQRSRLLFFSVNFLFKETHKV